LRRDRTPKPLTDEVVRAADVVITMGCGDACPVYPGKRYEDWQLKDPSGKDLAADPRRHRRTRERAHRQAHARGVRKPLAET
jgi:arsenate reductase